jgi:hypothetical protein
MGKGREAKKSRRAAETGAWHRRRSRISEAFRDGLD